MALGLGTGGSAAWGHSRTLEETAALGGSDLQDSDLQDSDLEDSGLGSNLRETQRLRERPVGDTAAGEDSEAMAAARL